MSYITVYDLDETLIEGSCYEAAFGSLENSDEKFEEITAIRERREAGELNFGQYLEQVYTLLESESVSSTQEAVNSIDLYSDVGNITQFMRDKSINQTIISNAPQVYVNVFGDKLDIGGYGLSLGIENDNFTGEVIRDEKTDILLYKTKWDLIKTIKEGNDVIAFGDGTNDYEMLRQANIGFAIHASDRLKNMIDPKDNIYVVDSFLEAIEILEREID